MFIVIVLPMLVTNYFKIDFLLLFKNTSYEKLRCKQDTMRSLESESNCLIKKREMLAYL